MMNTARRRCCQTLRTLAATALFCGPGTVNFAADAPSPTPPAWQQEIDAVRLLEGTLALAPAKDAEDEAARHRRLQEIYHALARKYSAEAAVQKVAADYFTRDGDLAAALPSWEKAAELDPHDGDTADRLGGLYLRLSRLREAYRQFQRAVATQPTVSSYHSDLANILYLFRRDLVSPADPDLPDDQAALLQALAHFRRAAELAPDDLRLAQAYAETYYVFAKPDWTQALAAWETVRTLSGEKTDFPDSHLARISLRLGRPDAATGYLARIHDPMFDGLKANLLRQADRQKESTPHP